MTVLAGLAIAGLCYCAVFLPDFPESLAHALMQFAVRSCCALGMAAVVCLLAFSLLDFLYRKELQRKRQHLLGVSIQP